MIRNIETAVENVFNYLQAQLPTYIAQINSNITDGITIDTPITWELNNIPSQTVATTFTLLDMQSSYEGFTFGFCQLDIEFDVIIEFVSNSIQMGRIKALRYLDAIQNLFLTDCSLGNNVIVSKIDRAHKDVDPNKGWLEVLFTSTIQIESSN